MITARSSFHSARSPGMMDDVVIIDDGRVVAAGEASAVRTGSAGRRVRLRVDPRGGADAAFAPRGVAAGGYGRCSGPSSRDSLIVIAESGACDAS